MGKTVLTTWMTRLLRAAGVNAVALKPVCSGGREDAVALHAASGGALSLDEVNPWHFRAALAPVMAARREGRGVRLAEVVAHVRAVASRFEVVLVEGAGGLLSPLGEDFDTRDWVAALGAVPIVVVPDRLGAVNQSRLVWEALPKRLRARALVVLMGQGRADAAVRSNAYLLSECVPGVVVVPVPWVGGRDLSKPSRRVASALKSLVDALVTR